MFMDSNDLTNIIPIPSLWDNLEKLDDSVTIGELNLLDNNDGTFSGTDDTNMVTLTVAFPDGEINSMTALDAHFDPESDGFIEQFFSDIA